MSTKRAIELARKLALPENERLVRLTGLNVRKSLSWAEDMMAKYGPNEAQKDVAGYRLMFVLNHLCPSLHHFHKQPDARRFKGDIEGFNRAAEKHFLENTQAGLVGEDGALIQEGVEYSQESWDAFLETLNEVRAELGIDDHPRLFLDMDGTLAEWRAAAQFEDLYQKDYFFSLAPHQEVVDAVKLLQEQMPELELFVLSAVLPDSEYAIPEKNAWLDKYCPFIAQKNRVFVHNGKSKRDSVPNGAGALDFLLDDYTKNLNEWGPSPAIKLLNGVNGTKGTWKGAAASRFSAADELANAIRSIIEGNPLLTEA